MRHTFSEHGANLLISDGCGCAKSQQRSCKLLRKYFKQAKSKRSFTQILCSASEAKSIQIVDKWIEKALKLVDAAPRNGRQNIHQQECLRALETQRMPTIRNEEYRYTDVSLLLRTEPKMASGSVSEEEVSGKSLGKDEEAFRLTIVNGKFIKELSDIGNLPQGCFIGSLGDAPNEIFNRLGEQAKTRGGPFAILNGALSEEILCIALEDGVELEKPIHCIHFSTGGLDSDFLPVSSSRLLVDLGKKSSCQVIEEYSSSQSASDSRSFTNSVSEFFLAEEANLRHKYIELEGSETWHMKASLVLQAEKSSYTLTEAQLGGKLTRHDLSIQQTGPDTETTMKAFLLCGPSQLHDLHSKLKMEHPRGIANQLHKCIVSASSGKGVFDGNVKVERFAQQTDAAQLSRNILLSPKATLNVKPNLQIVADDVKCSHGCAVSDLEEEQLFYFRARGIDYATARQVLVYSFGAEVTNEFKYKNLLDRIQKEINKTLAQAPLS